MIDKKEVHKHHGHYGSYFINITEEQIEKLKEGKVLVNDKDEYPVFIQLKKEE